ncbi:MAG: hypothetical protein FVQ79_12795 [Planctomycetes bacterium]|nr:hypothetical protein [Planctomycetota bacterium]
MTDESPNTNNNTNAHLTPRPMHSHSLKLVLSAMVILLAGMVIGSAATVIIVKSTRINRPRPPEHGPEQMAKRIKKSLHLTQEQSLEIVPIIEKHMQVLWHIRMGARPVITDQLNEMEDEIEPLLNEDQQKLWKRNVKKLLEPLQYFSPPRYGQRQGSGRYGRQRQRHRLPGEEAVQTEPNQ